MKTILIIEDENLIRSSLARALKRDGFSIAEAQDVNGALEAVRQKAWELVILDLYLGDGMHGLPMIREIHRQSPATKIIVITAFGTEEVRESALMEGIDRFYDKPFEISELRQSVKEVLGETHSPQDPEGVTPGSLI